MSSRRMKAAAFQRPTKFNFLDQRNAASKRKLKKLVTPRERADRPINVAAASITVTTPRIDAIKPEPGNRRFFAIPVGRAKARAK